MSDDLIERLRRGSFAPHYGSTAPVNPDGAEAADEIERLRAENARLREALAFYVTPENWMANGPLDPNSPHFTEGPARAALGRGGGNA